EEIALLVEVLDRRELVAASTGNVLTAFQKLADTLANEPQGDIARFQAAQVGDFLKAVEVDADDRYPTPISPGTRKLGTEMICEASAVRQARQGIVMRHVLQALRHILRRLGVDDVGRKSGAGDDEANACNGDAHRHQNFR